MIPQLQKKIINFVTKKTKKKNYSSNAFSYFAVFEKTPGYFLIKSFLNKRYYINFIFSFIKHFIGIANTKVKYLTHIEKNNLKKNIIVSWAFLNNFDKNGIYTDKYLKKKSNEDKENIWLLLYMDKVLPKKIDNNLILVHKTTSKLCGVIFFFSYILRLLKKNFLKLEIFKKINSFSSTSFQLIEILKKNIDIRNISQMLIVYEGQPFQKNIISFFKNQNKDIKVQGYDHSAPTPLPLNLIYDKYSPDELLITGKAQSIFYNKYLVWPSEKLKIIDSLRFKDEKKSFYMKKFFLPYEIRSPKVYLESIFYLSKLENLNFHTVRNHPLQNSSKKHLKLSKDIETIIRTETKNKSKEENFSIFLGQTTAVLIALDLGVICYHVCPDPIFDSYSQELWESITVKKLSENLFKYTSKKKNNFF